MAITLKGDDNSSFSSNVGVGTSSPAQRLHVSGGDGVKLQIDCPNDYSNASSILMSQSRGEITTTIDSTGGNPGGTLTFRTRNLSGTLVNRMTIPNDGHVSITDGDLKLANGHGINFSATSNVTGTASEILDDYEEGSWTPVLRGSSTAGSVSSGASYGQYIKIGKMVYATVRFEGVNFSGSSGAVQITGLPFASASVNAYAAAATAMTYYVSFDNTRNQNWYVSGSAMWGMESRSGTTWINWESSNFHTTNLYMNQQLIYEAA